MSRAHILVVDDEPDICESVRGILEDEGYEVTTALNGAAARAARNAQRPDLALLDIWMPDVDGITLLKEWSLYGKPAFPIIVMSGHATVETAVEATRRGAYEFLEKPLSMAKLLLTVQHALETARLDRENDTLRKHLYTSAEPLGRNPIMLELREQAARIAQHDAPVLIHGEPGTGKETLARYIHSLSARSAGPFLWAGMAAIRGQDAAIALFGAEQDGTVRDGLIEQANGGTLYISDIADLEPSLQSPLAQGLSSHSFQRIGGATRVRFDARIIAASHANLEEKVRKGEFRKELYYQLNVVPLNLPPLRVHSSDVPALIQDYVTFFVDQEGLTYKQFTVAAQNRLRNYSWPGNIRELRNVVQRLLILSAKDTIDIDDVNAALGSRLRDTTAPPNTMFTLPLREAREEFERAYFERRLKESGGSITKLARLAGIERTHLYRKLRALGINPKES